MLIQFKSENKTHINLFIFFVSVCVCLCSCVLESTHVSLKSN